jgi:putative ATP-binding cassette transporter
MIATPSKAPIPSPLSAPWLDLLGFLLPFIRLAGPFWNSEGKTKIRAWTLSLVVLTVLQISIPVLMAEWNARLFDALEQHSMSGVTRQIGAVVLILAANMAITYWHLKLKRKIQLEWRRWLTGHTIHQWMREGRHYQLAHLPGEHDNPDGRIAEDIRISTEYAIDLCHSLLYCLLLIVSFTGMLWQLSGTITVDLGLFRIGIPGHLVFLALMYAGGASYLAWKLGRPMTGATNERQTEEANFRFGLVRARENSEAIALVRGETDERRRFAGLFRGIVEAWGKQTTALSHILLFTSGYSILSAAFPVLVSAPRYIAGSITLGTLAQTAWAFQQMAAALSWPVDNLAKMAEWRASVERVLGLAKALSDLEEEITHDGPNIIAVESSDRPVLAFHGLCITDPDGEVVAACLNAEIGPGERVLVAGDASAGAKMFRAIAGLWPWGHGRVELPRDDRLFFMAPRPYLPIGTLREAIAYPSPAEAFGGTAIEQALEKVELAHLADRLGHADIWEKALTREEQQRLGIARLLLHRPSWILLQEVLDSLDPRGEAKMMQLVCDELPDAAILTITHEPAVEAFHPRRIVLQRPACDAPPVKSSRERVSAGGN